MLIIAWGRLPVHRKGSSMQLFEGSSIAYSFLLVRQVIKISVLTLLLVAILMLLQVGVVLNSPIAHANYSCGTDNTPHCYGEQEWDGPMYGAKTDITIQVLTCNYPCNSNGEIDDEMWVGAYNNDGCEKCWVEAGITNDNTTGGSTQYFWADARPNGGRFHLHYVNGVFVGDIGHKVIFRVAKTNSSTFEVDKANELPSSGGCSAQCSASWTNFSTSNSISPNFIQIGLELAGSSGASAPRVDFTNNYYLDSNLNPHPQTAAGQVFHIPPASDGNPIKTNWVNNHPGGPTGGDFYTSCC